MNIFACHPSAVLSVIYIEWWKHIIGLVKEAFQIAFSVHKVLGSSTESAPDGGFQRTHEHHPCVVWAAASRANYLWLLDYAEAMCNNYYAWTVEKNAKDVAARKPKSRTQKVREHACKRFIPWLRANVPVFPTTEPTPFVFGMKDYEQAKVLGADGKPDIHATYRNYVREDAAIERVKRRKEADDEKAAKKARV